MADSSEETKSKILTSAKAEFLEKGFTNASLRTIAANAGLTTGAMYRHFKDKDALFCALVDDAIDETLKMVKAGGVENHENLEDPIGGEHAENEKAFAEVILHNMDKEEATVFIGNIQEFFHFGFMHLLGLPCED